MATTNVNSPLEGDGQRLSLLAVCCDAPQQRLGTLQGASADWDYELLGHARNDAQILRPACDR